MSKRQRDAEAELDAVRRAVELVCQRPASSEGDGCGATATALTPLEKQVVRMKMSLPRDVVLMVACGYRVKFYGRDSRVASRRLGIMCIHATPFEYSSVPYVRANLYIHRLVAMGYRVAFADQENASIRAEDSTAKGIFAREVSRVYSRGTLLPSEVVGGANAAFVTADSLAHNLVAAENNDGGGGNVSYSLEDDENESFRMVSNLKEESSELFMCFVYSLSQPPNNDSAVTKTSAGEAGAAAMDVTLVSFVTYEIARYRVTSDAELLDILHRYKIVELIVFQDTKEEYSLASLSASLQCLPEVYVSALKAVLPLHFGPTCNGEEDKASVSVSVFGFTESMDESITRFLVQNRLDGVYKHMCSEDTPSFFLRGLDDHTTQTMELPGSTLSALDVFNSSIGVKGSLLALLDHTITLPGMRRLRVWLSNPLCDVSAILLRQEAVSFLLRKNEESGVAKLLRECAKFGDVEAILGKIRAQRCTVAEYLYLLRAVDMAYTLASDILLRCVDEISSIIRGALMSLTSDKVKTFLDSCRSELESQATSPLEYFTTFGVSMPAAMHTHLTARDKALAALDEELDRIRRVLGMPALEYRTIAGTSFVVDVPQAKCSHVPDDWLVLTRTKTHVRFHTVDIVNLNLALCSSRERLLIAANDAWLDKQEQLMKSTLTLNLFRFVINAIAELDALNSLAIVSSTPGYVTPKFSSDTGEDCLNIVAGRHPVLDRITRGGYVSCDVCLVKGGAWILTGPNMGGKSALMRMVGSFVVMAQMGCHVPAVAAQLPVFTAVFCRMGASDSMLEGSSTFLKEMEETSRILHSPRVSSSLVLLDELGRGTSSFDGIAVAAATLEYLLQQRATTLFVTHYSHLCEPYINSPSNGRVLCYYMGFCEEGTEATDGASRLVFTYKPVRGVTPSSFGVRVARMAGLPLCVLAEAQRLSEEGEREHTTRMALTQLRSFAGSSL